MRELRAGGRLRLSRETVRRIDGEQLEAAGGGQVSLICSLQWGCLPSQAGCTGYYPSWNAPCSVDGC